MAGRMKGNALITGASSGIGRALALELARRGYGLALTARRLPLLEELRDEINRASGGRTPVALRALDVTDFPRVEEAVRALDGELPGGIDLLVANAGTSGLKGEGVSRADSDLLLLNTNLLGAVASLRAGAALMAGRGRGRLVGVSSVAGFRGLAAGAAYSASKAGLSTYLEGLRGELKNTGVKVTVLNPGYIDTPLNRHKKKRPFAVPAEKGARLMADLIERGVDAATVPRWPWVPLGWILRNFPDFLWSRFNAA